MQKEENNNGKKYIEVLSNCEYPLQVGVLPETIALEAFVTEI
ncbi:hypothetical protein [Desulfosporosinus fructosivorans]